MGRTGTVIHPGLAAASTLDGAQIRQQQYTQHVVDCSALGRSVGGAQASGEQARDGSCRRAGGGVVLYT